MRLSGCPACAATATDAVPASVVAVSLGDQAESPMLLVADTWTSYSVAAVRFVMSRVRAVTLAEVVQAFVPVGLWRVLYPVIAGLASGATHVARMLVVPRTANVGAAGVLGTASSGASA